MNVRESVGLSTIRELESCLLVELSEKDLSAIRDEPFALACNEVLAVGDCFTEIGSTGSAGNQPVTLTNPWVQRYQGLLRARKSHFDSLPGIWDGSDLVLFDAFNPDDMNEGFVSPGYRAKWKGNRNVEDGYFIAYLRHCDNKLFHTRGGSASSVCQCTSLTRWFARPDHDICGRAQGAYITHSLRTDKTKRKIAIAIESLKSKNKRVTKAAVSREIGISREHINRRYKHLFAS